MTDKHDVENEVVEEHTEERRKDDSAVYIERRRQKSLPAWAGTSSRLATRARQARDERFTGRAPR